MTRLPSVLLLTLSLLLNIMTLQKPVYLYAMKVTLVSKCTFQMDLVNSDEEDKCTWKSSDTFVASVDDKGLVTGHNIGTAVITCITPSGKSLDCEFNVVYNKFSVPKITAEDVAIGQSRAKVYSASFAKSGDLVIRYSIFNKRRSPLESTSLVLKCSDDSGKVFAGVSIRNKSTPIDYGKRANYKITIPKETLVFDNVNLAGCKFTITSKFVYE